MWDNIMQWIGLDRFYWVLSTYSWKFFIPHVSYLKINTELSAALQRGCVSGEIWAPIGIKLLNTKFSECIIPCITYPIILSRFHQSLVHMKTILQIDLKQYIKVK